jgi:hemoglobin-like flavoprotein
MTPESIARIRTSFAEVTAQPRALASRFYAALFAEAPRLRPLFPPDLPSLQDHFEAALALVVRNMEEMAAIEESLRELGAQHARWGARPEDYILVREMIIRAIRESSTAWTETLEGDWRRAITGIAVPMLQGAAVHTAIVAEQLADEM